MAKNGGHFHFKPKNTVMVSFVAHFGQVSDNFDRSLAFSLPLSRSNSYQPAVKRRVKWAGLICRTDETYHRI